MFYQQGHKEKTSAEIKVFKFELNANARNEVNRAQSQKPNQNNQKIQRFLPNQKLADSITANSLTKIIHTHTHTESQSKDFFQIKCF